MTDLDRKAFRSIAWLLAVMAALLFVPAGTLAYWQAWAFLGAMEGSSLALTVYVMKHDQALLARRMRGGPTAEKEWRQKIILWIASAGCAALLVVPALDQRFDWSAVPAPVSVLGDALVALGILANIVVFRENSFAAAIIDVAAGQRVVSTGPYAIVRHPMYAGAFVMLLGVPLALASWWGLLVLAAIMPALIWRLVDEERFLARNLPGYSEYRDKVRYRLVPGVW